jgi:hypothetical protein
MWSKKLLVTLVIIGLFSAGSNCMQPNNDWVIDIKPDQRVMLEDARTREQAVANAAARVAELLGSTKVLYCQNCKFNSTHGSPVIIGGGQVLIVDTRLPRTARR